MDIKRYLIWRHDNAIGNTLEQVIGLTQQLQKGQTPESQIEILLEKPWQKTMAQSSPLLVDAKFTFIKDGATTLGDESVIVPNVYRESNSFVSSWDQLESQNANCLSIDEDPVWQFDLVFMFKSKSFRHPGESSNLDAHRFVSESKYRGVILALARRGYKVARIGGPEQKRLPDHPNISDFSGQDPTMFQDLRLLAASKLNVFTDSGLWPLSVGLGKRTVICDIVSDYGSFLTHRVLPFIGIRVGKDRTAVFKWASETDTVLLHKKKFNLGSLHIFIPVGKKRILSEIEFNIRAGNSGN